MRKWLKVLRFKKNPGGRYVHVKVKNDIYVAAPVWAVVTITCSVIAGILALVALFISPFWQ